jgi:hypothetical protein
VEDFSSKRRDQKVNAEMIQGVCNAIIVASAEQRQP